MYYSRVVTINETSLNQSLNTFDLSGNIVLQMYPTSTGSSRITMNTSATSNYTNFTTIDGAFGGIQGNFGIQDQGSRNIINYTKATNTVQVGGGSTAVNIDPTDISLNTVYNYNNGSITVNGTLNTASTPSYFSIPGDLTGILDGFKRVYNVTLAVTGGGGGGAGNGGATQGGGGGGGGAIFIYNFIYETSSNNQILSNRLVYQVGGGGSGGSSIGIDGNAAQSSSISWDIFANLVTEAIGGFGGSSSSGNGGGGGTVSSSGTYPSGWQIISALQCTGSNGSNGSNTSPYNGGAGGASVDCSGNGLNYLSSAGGDGGSYGIAANDGTNGYITLLYSFYDTPINSTVSSMINTLGTPTNPVNTYISTLYTNNVYGYSYYTTFDVPADQQVLVGSPTSLNNLPKGLYSIITSINDLTNPNNPTVINSVVSTTIYVADNPGGPNYRFYGGNGEGFYNYNQQNVQRTFVNENGLNYYNSSSDHLLVTIYFIKMFGDLTYPTI
jgi:hypothetical protein